jgi:hypothetical protein
MQKLRLMRGYSPVVTFLLASVPLLITQPAGANPIPQNSPLFGIFNGGNLSVQVTGLGNSGPSGPCINFFNGASPDACTAVSTSTFNLNGPSDAIFGSTVVPQTMGTIHDFILSNQTGSAPGLAPYGGNGTGFITLNGFTFDITNIVVPGVIGCPPVGAPAVCTSGDFTLTQSDLLTPAVACPGGSSPCGHVSVTFSAQGIGYSGSSVTGSTPYTFIWSSQFDNETIADLLSKANTVVGGIQNSVSFTAAPIPSAVTPEPSEFALVGGGLLLVSLLTRSRIFSRRS